MGAWLSLPEAEGILALNLARGRILKSMKRTGRSVLGGSFDDVHVCADRRDTGNAIMADIEGIDCDIINKDLVDCDDWS